jgi:hypothetical protein
MEVINEKFAITDLNIRAEKEVQIDTIKKAKKPLLG